MKHLPVALQLYSVRDDAEKDFEGTLRAVKEMGYDGVEFAGFYGKTPAEVKKLCEEIGLVPLSTHMDVSIDEMCADADAHMKRYAEVGLKYAAIPYLPEDRRPASGNFEKTLEDIKLIGEVANRNGLTLLYHNHDFEFVKIGDAYALDVLYDTVPASLLQTELDTCWVNVGGENPAEYLKKYTGRAPVVHLKDFVMAGKKPEHMYELIGIAPEGEAASEEAFGFRPVGYGVQNMPAILDASLEAGATWVVVEQDRPGPDKTPMESVKMSRDYLKTLGW